MYVIIYDYWEDLKDYIPEDVYKSPNTVGITIDYEDHCIVCCSSNPKHLSTIVHEAGHVKNMIWKYIGYTPIRDNDEVDQYLHAYIYETIVKVLNQHIV
jgi:hypothetical protein